MSKTYRHNDEENTTQYRNRRRPTKQELAERGYRCVEENDGSWK